MIKEMFFEFKNYLEINTNIEFIKEKCTIRNSNIPEDMILDDIKFIEENAHIIIEKNDLNFIKISSDSICWSYTNMKNQFIYGGFQINGYLEALLQDSTFWDVYNSINKHEPENKELELLKKLNWFEKQSWGDDGKFGCFLREPGNFPPKIYFYDYGAVFQTTLSLDKYFDAMIASCAVRGWQYFYIDMPDNFPNLPKVNKSIVLQDSEFIVEMLSKLFPDKDFNYHKDRLKYLKDKLK